MAEDEEEGRGGGGLLDAADGLSDVAEIGSSIGELFSCCAVDACYVATAAHGELEAPEVVDLRRYRDARLRHNVAGRAFIAVYYAVGPYPAWVINRFPVLRAPARKLLAPAVWWARRSLG